MRKSILVGVVLSLLLGLFVFGRPIFAQTTAQSTNAEIAKLEAEIASYKNELAKTQAAGNTLANAVKEIDLNQKKIEADMKLIEQKITKTNLEIGQLGNQWSRRCCS